MMADGKPVGTISPGRQVRSPFDKLNKQEICAYAPVRGVLESLYNREKTKRSSKAQYSRAIMSIYMEGSALCGGQICAWCLQAIPLCWEIDGAPPKPSQEKVTALAAPLPSQAMATHHITLSTTRCTCVNDKGSSRRVFRLSQSLFFTSKEQYITHRVLGQAIQDGKNEVILAAFQFFTKEYGAHHQAVMKVDKELFIRVGRYCANMTALGIICSLCAQRRVDISLYNHFNTHYHIPIGEDYGLCCFECMNELLKVSSDAPDVPTLEKLTRELEEAERNL